MNYGYGNPYGYMPQNNQNFSQQIQNQIQQLQALQSNLNATPTQTTNSNAMRGNVVSVSGYQEVINTPTEASGSPTLFLNEKDGVFWVKKFIDGTNKIQAFKYEPINDFGDNNINSTRDNEKGSQKGVEQANNEYLENLQERTTTLEDKVDKILGLLSKPKKEKVSE